MLISHKEIQVRGGEGESQRLPHYSSPQELQNSNLFHKISVQPANSFLNIMILQSNSRNLENAIEFINY